MGVLGARSTHSGHWTLDKMEKNELNQSRLLITRMEERREITGKRSNWNGSPTRVHRTQNTGNSQFPIIALLIRIGMASRGRPLFYFHISLLITPYRLMVASCQSRHESSISNTVNSWHHYQRDTNQYICIGTWIDLMEEMLGPN